MKETGNPGGIPVSWETFLQEYQDLPFHNFFLFILPSLEPAILHSTVMRMERCGSVSLENWAIKFSLIKSFTFSWQYHFCWGPGEYFLNSFKYRRGRQCFLEEHLSTFISLNLTVHVFFILDSYSRICFECLLCDRL